MRSSSKIYNSCKEKEKETLNGYRNLNLIANTAPECIRPRVGRHDLCDNCLYLGPSLEFGVGKELSRILLVDCFMGKIKLNEQRSLQNTKRFLQNKKRLLQVTRTMMHMKNR